MADFFGSAGKPMKAWLRVNVEIPKSSSRSSRKSSSQRMCRELGSRRAVNGSPLGGIVRVAMKCPFVVRASGWCYTCGAIFL
jgi:hypothetical protein